MTPDRWDRAKSIFGGAIEVDPSQREQYVRRAVKGDEALFSEVMSLLKADSTETILSSPVVFPPVPSLLKDRYRVERELGRGGLGVVYLARDETLHGRPVVIKMPLECGASDPWLAGKFAEEVKALALIDHPGVVGALDSGVATDGRPFLVMQYVDGRPLQATIPPDGVPLERAAHLLRQIGQALGAAHARGIWHRDIKPANIMLRRLQDGSEHVRLIDFGISSVKDAPGGETGTRAAGTPPYMAPEQLEGRVSQASDIWAMGVIAYELVTGRKPFLAENVIQLRDLQRAGPSIRPSLLRPSLPVSAEHLILRALSFRPQDRPQSASEFGEELAAALTSVPAPTERRSRRVMLAAIGTAAIGGGAAAWWKLRPLPRHSLAYSLMVQPMRGGQPAGSPVPAPVNSAFRPSDGFFFVFRPAEPAHLYLLSDDPRADTLTTLFPSPFMYHGLSRLNANEQKRIPQETWYMFDEQPGVADLWFVWSAEAVPEMESLVRWINEQDRGSIKEPAERARLRQALAAMPGATPAGAQTGAEASVSSSAARFAWRLHLETGH